MDCDGETARRASRAEDQHLAPCSVSRFKVALVTDALGNATWTGYKRPQPADEGPQGHQPGRRLHLRRRDLTLVAGFRDFCDTFTRGHAKCDGVGEGS